jgi:hypothetical protein
MTAEERVKADMAMVKSRAILFGFGWLVAIFSRHIFSSLHRIFSRHIVSRQEK